MKTYSNQNCKPQTQKIPALQPRGSGHLVSVSCLQGLNWKVKKERRRNTACLKGECHLVVTSVSPTQ